MGLFDSPTPFKGQDYDALKKSCLETGQPFEDPEFLTTYSSLFFTPDKVGRLRMGRSGISWDR